MNLNFEALGYSIQNHDIELFNLSYDIELLERHYSCVDRITGLPYIQRREASYHIEFIIKNLKNKRFVKLMKHNRVMYSVFIYYAVKNSDIKLFQRINRINPINIKSYGFNDIPYKMHKFMFEKYNYQENKTILCIQSIKEKDVEIFQKTFSDEILEFVLNSLEDHKFFLEHYTGYYFILGLNPVFRRNFKNKEVYEEYTPKLHPIYSFCKKLIPI